MVNAVNECNSDNLCYGYFAVPAGNMFQLPHGTPVKGGTAGAVFWQKTQS
jgi:hypothetical protein